MARPVEEPGATSAQVGPGAKVLVLNTARKKERGFSVSLEADGTHLVDPVESGFPGRLEQALWQLVSHRRGAGDLTRASGVAAISSYIEDLHRVGEDLAKGLFLAPIGDLIRQEIQRAQSRGEPLDIVFASEEDLLFSLPLEAVRLMGERPLALEPRVRIYRRLSGAQASHGVPVPGPLRVLVAVGSPDAQNERGELLDMERELRAILDALEPAIVDGRAIVEILEVGSVDHIRKALQREPFHVLHVSCHGLPGRLILEMEDGGEDKVSADRLAEVLTSQEKKVQLVFLSGCLTGVAGAAEKRKDDKEGSAALPGFAQGLLRRGIPAVVAMQGPVGDRYATDLSASFYNHLTAGESPIPAVALAGARQQVEEARLERVRDGVPPEDPDNVPEWATPALYLVGDPHPLYDAAASFDKRKPAPEVQFDPGVCVRRIGDFIGRRREVREMARALRDGTPGALLYGMGGVGKSSLAAHLLDRLQGDGRIVASTVGPTSLHGILEAAAQQLLAHSVSAGEDERSPLREKARFLRDPNHHLHERWAYFVQHVIPEVRLLLLLDNFEDNVRGPSKEGEWEPADRFPLRDGELAAGLAMLLNRPGRARLVITSRYPIALLNGAEDLLLFEHLGPLSPAEGRKLMLRLDGLRPLRPEEKVRVFRQVGGHPRALEYLDAILRGGEARFQDITRRLAEQHEASNIDPASMAGDLDAALAGTITAASEDVLLDTLLQPLERDSLARRLVDGASVYRRTVDRAGLVWQVAEELERDAEPSEPGGLGEAIGHIVGTTLLIEVEEASGERRYVVHRWTARALEARISPARRREAHVRAARWWDYRVRNVSHDLDEHIEALEHFLQAEAVEEATPIAEAVCRRLETWGRWSEEEAICRRMIDHLEEISGERAGFLHELGVVAQHRGDYDGALDWYRKSLAICEELGDRANVAVAYHQLGILAHFRGDYDDALEWYRKSLAIFEKLGDRANVAIAYHQLGMLAQFRGDYDGALEWYRKSLAIKEELGDRAGMASAYGQMGYLAEHRGDYDGALEWCREALAIFEELGDLAGLASSYHQLGILAQGRGDYDGALEWCRKSLAIFEKLGDRANVAIAYHQLGILAQGRGDYDGALEWYGKSLAIKEELGDRAGMASSIGQLGILEVSRGKPEEAIPFLMRSMSMYKSLGSPNIQIVVNCLDKIREALGDTCFNELLRKHGADPSDLES